MWRDMTYQKYVIIRDERGISDYAVAKATGISRSLFSEWKSNKYAPKVDKLIKIADFFNVPIEYFLSDKGKS